MLLGKDALKPMETLELTLSRVLAKTALELVRLQAENERLRGRVQELLEYGTRSVNEFRSINWTCRVRDFCSVTNRKVYDINVTPPKAVIRLCVNLCLEEVEEAVNSVLTVPLHLPRVADEDIRDKPDLVELADGVIDSIYVCLYFAIVFGIDPRPLFVEVQKKNMEKASAPKHPVTGKQMKPEGWTPPDIAGLLRAQGARL